MNQELFIAVDQYIENLFSPPDNALESALHTSSQAGLPAINITPNQGKLLHVLALSCGARKILEIGALGGYSAIWMARALPIDGQLISLEFDPTHAQIARANIANAGLSKQIEVREGRALDLLPQLETENAGPFDLIFIDADKKPYTEYLQWALRLSRPGALIVADNVVRKGEVLNTDNPNPDVAGIQQFNTRLAAESRVTATIVPLVSGKGYDGLAIAVVRE